jgi:hypothetical protein
MIDENSHYSQPTKVGESNLFSLRKRAPIESLFNFHQILRPSFRSQEPRRPRFSFFYLHNVKELTQKTSRPQRHMKASAFRNLAQNNLSPVARKPVCLCQKH